MKTLIYIFVFSVLGLSKSKHQESLVLRSEAHKVEVALELSHLQEQNSHCLHKATTTLEYKVCALEHSDHLDVILNREYQKIMNDLKEGDEFEKVMKRRLRRSQRVWLKFREANCLFQATWGYGGTAESLEAALCANEMTEARIKEWLEFYYFVK